jgi:hypothetical protein
MAAVYLDQLLDNIDTLPSELQRNFSLIRELDVQTDRRTLALRTANCGL